MNFKIVEQNDRFAVIDDFLSMSEHYKIYDYLQGQRFEFVHSKRKIPAFRLNDGNPLWSEPVLSHPWNKNTLYKTYPVSEDIDIIISKILDITPKFSNLVGQHLADWVHFFIRGYLYPQGCGLSWHKDGKYQAPGAFVYYAHPEWQLEWGGELLISECNGEATHTSQAARHSNYLCNTSEKKIFKKGVGDYILPKPNRFVLMKGMNFHTIKKVDRAAGDNVRMTLQGFFQSAEISQNFEGYNNGFSRTT